MKTKLKVLGTNIKIKLDVPKTHGFDISSVKISQESAEVIGVGDKVTLPIKVGDKVLFKSWAVDIIGVGDETHYYINEATGGIKEVI